MPIYTYRCENCGVQFDRRQKFSDDPLTICPECETETLHKVYLPVGIVFKGSGFYSTDNKSPSGRKGSRKLDTESTKPKTESTATAKTASSDSE
ncbi:MAG: zinc ribbon domain-containing protein [Chloroflexota bacterium]|nr:zinc ribbon domain-containing protein [Chloroflexota bacterium]